MSGSLVRRLYTRASQSGTLRGPLSRVRSHPRVRAFARRRVDILLARGTTWANVDGALRLLGEDPLQPIVFGPWQGDLAMELLYWAPFVRWAQRHFAIDPQRVAVVSRPGGEHVYAETCERYFATLDEARTALPGAVVFRPEPVTALFDEYRSGAGPLRPLLKRQLHVRLRPAAERTHAVTEYGGTAILTALTGEPVIAIRPAGESLVEPDVDLALRVVSSLGGSFVVLDADELQGLRKALGSTASPPERAVQ